MNPANFNIAFARAWEAFTVTVSEDGVLDLRQMAFDFWEKSFEQASGIELNIAPLPATEGSCAHEVSKVVDVRPCARSIRRRRQCEKCGERWNTFELYSQEVAEAEEEPEP